MNLIQIANGMGRSMYFGDLPKYSYVINKINDILPEDTNITPVTSGAEFLVIYNGLKPELQNQLASVIEDDLEIRLEIASDIAMNEYSKRSREKTAFRHNARLILIVVGLLTIANIYMVFNYHYFASHLLGDLYDSRIVNGIDNVFNFIGQIFITLPQ